MQVLQHYHHIHSRLHALFASSNTFTHFLADFNISIFDIVAFDYIIIGSLASQTKLLAAVRHFGCVLSHDRNWAILFGSTHLRSIRYFARFEGRALLSKG